MPRSPENDYFSGRATRELNSKEALRARQRRNDQESIDQLALNFVVRPTPCVEATTDDEDPETDADMHRLRNFA